MTDNPFLGFSRPYAPLRASVNSFVRTGGQIGGSHPVSSVPDKVLRHWLHPSISPDKRKRVGLYLANSRYWNNERRSFAAKVMKDAVRALEQGSRRRPFALIVDTYEPHEPWTPPPPYVDMYGKWSGREPAMPRYGKVDNWLRAGPARAGRAPAAGALRGRGDDDRPLAGRADEPRARPRPREPDGDRARVRPRHPARRARLDGQDLDGPPPRPDARPAGDRRPRPPARRPVQPLLRLDPRHRADAALDDGSGGAQAHERRGPVGHVRGQAAAQARLRLRRLRQLVLHPHAPLGAVGAQQAGPLPPVRHAPRPERGARTSRTGTRGSCTGSTGSCAGVPAGACPTTAASTRMDNLPAA